MRRSPRIALILVVLLLIVVIGGYTAYWLVAAQQIKTGIAAWAQAMRAQRLDVAWQGIRIAGYPFAFRVELTGARLHDTTMQPAADLTTPTLVGIARPWNFHVWRLVAADGLAAKFPGIGSGLGFGFGGRAAGLDAHGATGAVAIAGSGAATVWLTLDDATLEAGESVAVRTLDCWLMLPKTPPQSHTERDFAFAARFSHITLPMGVPPLGNTIEALAFNASVHGAVPAAKLRPALAAWRDSGGTLELHSLHLAWGALALDASGTAALDQNLQPMGSFSGAIQGYGRVMAALVANGRMSSGNAELARLALAMLAKPGPDGQPEIATSFTIQDGEMYLGPARLGRVPRIVW
jgi:hypothetical protein